MLPWEPKILANGHELESDFIPEEGDLCLECNKPLKNTMISDGRFAYFCSWECAIKRAERFPNIYEIIDRTIY